MCSGYTQNMYVVGACELCGTNKYTWEIPRHETTIRTKNVERNKNKVLSIDTNINLLFSMGEK